MIVIQNGKLLIHEHNHVQPLFTNCKIKIIRKRRTRTRIHVLLTIIIIIIIIIISTGEILVYKLDKQWKISDFLSAI